MTTSNSDLPALVPTCATQEIEACLDAAGRRRLFGFISGETGRSKTLTCRHYAASHADVTMIELPAAVNSAELVRLVAESLLGNDFGTQRANRAEIRKYLKSDRKSVV